MKYFQSFRISGNANAITYDGGLKSTAAEKKRLIACHIQLDKHAGTDDNDILGYHERAKVFDIPEKLFPSLLTAAVASRLSAPESRAVPVDLDIPIGEIFKVAVKCSATPVIVRGSYEYEMIT